MFCDIKLVFGNYFFQELLMTLATTVSKGGNLLVNVGPTKEGSIDPVMQERLEQLGQWLRINGEAVCLFANYCDFRFKSTEKHFVYKIL
jgi:alpha-L-fucosidase